MTGRSGEFPITPLSEQTEKLIEPSIPPQGRDDNLSPPQSEATAEIDTHDSGDSKLNAVPHEVAVFLEDIVETHGRFLANVARNKLRQDRHSGSDDLLQDTYAAFLQTNRNGLVAYDRSGEELMLTILRRKAIDAYRRRAEESQTHYMDNDTSEQKDAMMAALYPLYDEADESNVEEIITTVLGQLTHNQKEVLIQTSKELDQPMDGALRIRRYRAMAAARSAIAQLHRSGGISLPPALIRKIGSGGAFKTKEVNSQEISAQKKSQLARLRTDAIDYIREYRERGESEITVRIPEYIGQWTVAALLINDYLETNPSSEMSVAIAWDDGERLDELEAHLKPILGKNRRNVAIDTPTLVGDLAPPQGFSILITAAKLSKYRRQKLDSEGLFLISLAQNEGDVSEEQGYIAPDYKGRAGRGGMDWTLSDSIRLAQEWYLATGQPLKSSYQPFERKSGPTSKRLLGELTLDELNNRALAALQSHKNEGHKALED
ncbi:MAG TPA: hypothetical protein VF733_02655 [Candidatus Saccharimonadales bacterium]